jgi:hypothetical protein
MKLVKQLKFILIIFYTNLFLFSYPFVKNSFAAPTCTGTNIRIAVGETCSDGLSPFGTDNVSIINAGTVTSPNTVFPDRAIDGINFTFSTGGSITNTGTITSGTHSDPDFAGFAIKVHISDLTSVTNSGIIASSGSGGSAFFLNAGTIPVFTNTGIIRTTTSGTSEVAIINNGTMSNFINSGTISGGINGTAFTSIGASSTTLNNSGTISGATAFNINGATANITNSGTITGTTASINNSGVINLTLNQGSKLIGTITNSGTLNITSNVGAAKSYAYSGTVTSLTDSNNRPSALGSAAAINIGSMEMAGENLYQKTANITDAIDRNVKNNKDTWVEPYYSESTRDSGGDSSQIRQFKNNKQGINAGFKAENSATPLQIIFNVDQTKNNIDSSEHVINGDGVMIGLMAPSYAKYEGIDVSVKGLVGYANSKTDRKILDNTSSTGERTLTGEYDSYYAVVGSALSKNYNLDKDLNANLTLGVDLTSEFRDSYSENLYFKYNSLDLVQLQPRIQSEFIKTTGKDSNVFLTAGVGAREVLSGKTQKYSMNNTGVSFTAPNSGDYYASLAVGTNMNVAANVNFYTLVSAKMSDRDTETYQASIGLKGTF